MIPEYLLAKIEKSDVIYRCIGNEMKNGILACGFMRKETADRSQYHFSNEYYSCFVLLRGSGEYIAEDGTSYPLQAGSLVQRLQRIGGAAFHTRRPRWEMAGIFYLDWETVF